ncbi:MAG: 23S rRNA (adenine(2503)-C(2))-methyltransferase RlmN [Bacilli bacterium]
MKSIYEYNLDELETIVVEQGLKKYRAAQLFDWLYVKKVNDINLMSNIKKDILEQLSLEYRFNPLKEVMIQESNDGTIKYLFELEDGNLVETVLMRYDYGNSVCVSSQVGCNMGCKFCASGKLKKLRNLSAGEIVAQVAYVAAHIAKRELRVSHIVVMGIGEPFDNYDNVMQFVRIVNNPFGLAIGARHITISTCGVISGIKKYQTEPFQTNLAISLHAASDEKRSLLMPINHKHNLQELKQALLEYIDQTNRRITIEYILLKGVNDQKEDALLLAKYLKGIHCYVNLIPYNSVEENDFKNVSQKEAFTFYQWLKEAKINVTIRKEHGSDIDAACGQLRSKQIGE